MSDVRSSVLLHGYTGEQHLVAVDEIWRVSCDDERILFRQHPLQIAVVIDGLIRAVNTVVDTGGLSADIKNQAGLPNKIERATKYAIKVAIPEAIGSIIAKEEFPQFSSHMHVLGRGSGSRYMLIDDERGVTTRLSVFADYAAENEGASNERILEEMRVLPLGTAMRRTVAVKGEQQKDKSGELEPDRKPPTSPVEGIRFDEIIAPNIVAEREQLSGPEKVLLQKATSRVMHLGIAGMDPYKVIILDMIMHSGAPMSDESIKMFLKQELGKNFSGTRAETGITSMSYNPFIGRNSRVAVHTFIQAGKPVTMFGRVTK